MVDMASGEDGGEGGCTFKDRRAGCRVDVCVCVCGGGGSVCGGGGIRWLMWRLERMVAEVGAPLKTGGPGVGWTCVCVCSVGGGQWGGED